MDKVSYASVEVTRLAGVSLTTVSFVLNSTPGKIIPEETRQRVLAAARSLDCQPDSVARMVAKATKYPIGLAIRGRPGDLPDRYRQPVGGLWGGPLY